MIDTATIAATMRIKARHDAEDQARRRSMPTVRPRVVKHAVEQEFVREVVLKKPPQSQTLPLLHGRSFRRA